MWTKINRFFPIHYTLYIGNLYLFKMWTKINRFFPIHYTLYISNLYLFIVWTKINRFFPIHYTLYIGNLYLFIMWTKINRFSLSITPYISVISLCLTLYSIDRHFDTSTTDRFWKHCGKRRIFS